MSNGDSGTEWDLQIIEEIANDIVTLVGRQDLDLGELLVGLYELAKSHRQMIKDSLFIEFKDQPRIEEMREHLSEVLPQNDTPEQAWSLSSSFARRLTQLVEETLFGKDALFLTPMLLKIAIESLDEHLGSCHTRHHKGMYRYVQSPLPPGNEHYVVARSPDRYPPWREDRPPKSGANLGGEGWLSCCRILPAKIEGNYFRYCLLESEELDINFSLARGKGEYGLRLAIWPVSRFLRPHANLSGSKFPYRSSGNPYNAFYFEEEDGSANLLEQALENILQQCKDQNVSILVMPELSVGPSLLKMIEHKLLRNYHATLQANEMPRPLLVVAGSFHEKLDDGRWANRATVLDYMGNPCQLRQLTKDGWSEGQSWVHDKLDRFGITRRNLALERVQLDEHGDLLRLENALALDDDEVGGACEPESNGKSVLIVDSALGRICTLICIDLLTEAKKWHDMVQPAFLDWLLVPTASPKTSKYRDDLWAIDGAAALIANSCWLLDLIQTWEHADVALFSAPNPHLRDKSFRWQTTCGAVSVTSGAKWWSPPLEPEKAGQQGPQQRSSHCAWSCEDGCLLILEISDPYPGDG